MKEVKDLKNEKKKDKKIINKKKIIILGSIILLIVIGIVLSLTFKKEEKESTSSSKEEQEIVVPKTLEIKDDLSFEINSEITISNLIANKNKLDIKNENENVDTSVLGEHKIIIKYIDNEEKEQEMEVTIKIVDTVAPEIEYEEEVITKVNKSINLLKNVKATDNSKEDIEVKVEGNYDIKKAGTYNLKYVASDSSGNKIEKSFVLKVEKVISSNSTTTNNNNNNSNSNNSKPSTNQKPSSTTNNDKEDYYEEDDNFDKIDYANSVVALDFGTVTVDSAVIYFDGSGSIGANYFELFVYSEDGKLLNTYQVKGTPRTSSEESNSFKLTNLGFRTTYYLHAKSYKEENGKKEFLCQTENFGDYKAGRNFFTEHDDTVYMNKMFEGINKNSGNKFTRDANLDKAAKTCAKKYHDNYLAGNDSYISPTDCLAENGITNVASAKFVHLDFPGKICVVGTDSCTGIVFSYVGLEDVLKNYQFEPSYIGSHKHIGVTYYENVAGAIYVTYDGE